MVSGSSHPQILLACIKKFVTEAQPGSRLPCWMPLTGEVTSALGFPDKQRLGGQGGTRTSGLRVQRQSNTGGTQDARAELASNLPKSHALSTVQQSSQAHHTYYWALWVGVVLGAQLRHRPFPHLLQHTHPSLCHEPCKARKRVLKMHASGDAHGQCCQRILSMF